ncbi:MAG TPA: heme o synthase [Saprospiraceae bacterium]|nr:heme o synthase [Saprospiraceae bacterium]HRP41515.1 heme o synthase [Saprospiraceae bacterium]
MRNNNEYTAALVANHTWIGKIYDYGLLVKLRLNLVVVISSIFGFFIVSQGNFSWVNVLTLFVGGFLVTGAANALNQVFEKDYDILMKRTANRPVASGRMKQTEAIIFAGIACIIGISLLSTFNSVTAFLGMISLVLYAFVYTPLKRYSTIAVAVGAIPGALPVLIGMTAYEGRITVFALLLFVIQFLWQFPHFWAIGFLGYEDYKRAGYKLLPESNGEIDRNLGLSSMFYATLIIPVALIMQIRISEISLTSTVISVILSLIYMYCCFQLHSRFDKKSALILMFYSFLFLPLILLGYWLF